MTTLKKTIVTAALTLVVCAAAFAGETPEMKKQSEPDFLVIAHRGASGHAPENTLSAFRKAIEMGADMYELDVRLAGDGEMIVMHDDKVDRTTNGKGKLSEFTLDELKKLDAGSWYGPEFAGERIPTLREALEAARGKIKVNIEVKESGFEERIAALVDEMKMTEDVLITAFDHGVIVKLKKLNPSLRTGALVGDITPDEMGERISPLGCDTLNPRYTAVTKSLVRKAHENGLKVYPYTVNDTVSMQMIIKTGVDGIITNYPDTLAALLAKKSKKQPPKETE